MLTEPRNYILLKTESVQVSYNAAGVLAHMASDGPEAWTIKQPDREHVLFRMSRAINRLVKTWPNNFSFDHVVQVGHLF